LKKHSKRDKKKPNSLAESFDPPDKQVRPLKQQPKARAEKKDVEMIIDTTTKDKKSDSIYHSIEIQAVLNEMEIDSDERDDYLESWANAGENGELDEFVNKPEMVAFKFVCDKMLKEQGLQDVE
jgi:hypothetical protein